MWRLRYDHFRRDYDALSAALLATPYEVLALAVISLLIAGAVFAGSGGASYLGRVVHCLLYPTATDSFR